MSEWIPLMDYAMKTGVSLSTLRRHIKANKVRYRIEGGKYLILLDTQSGRQPERSLPVHGYSENTLTLDFEYPSSQTISQASQQDVLNELKKAHEEIAELKTLIAFYEESMNSAHP